MPPQHGGILLTTMFGYPVLSVRHLQIGAPVQMAYSPGSQHDIPPLGRRSADADAIAPDGSQIRLLLDERHAATGASMVEVTLRAGQISRPVHHQTVEEVWYILEGVGQVWRSPPEVSQPENVPAMPVSAGDSLVIPVGWNFQFSAGDASDLRFLCITMPPWPGEHEAQPARSGGLGEPTI